MRAFLVAAWLTAFATAPAWAFSLDQAGPAVGSRDGSYLNAYDKVKAGTTIDRAEKLLQHPSVRAECQFDGGKAPCLVETLLDPEVRVSAMYFFPDRKLQFIAVYLMPATADGAWFRAPAQIDTVRYCDAIGDRLLNLVIADAGLPDTEAPASWYRPDARFDLLSPAALAKGRGYDTLTKAARFTYPAGGRIVFERIVNTDDQECLARAIYYLAW